MQYMKSDGPESIYCINCITKLCKVVLLYKNSTTKHSSWVNGNKNNEDRAWGKKEKWKLKKGEKNEEWEEKFERAET